MKTTRLVLGTVLAAGLMAGGTALSRAVEVDVNLPTPRLQSLTAAATGGVPDISLQFHYDATGKILFAPGSTVGTNAVTGTTALVKKAGGALSYTITAKGTVNKTLTVSLKGLLDASTASCSYKDGTTKAAVTNLAVVIAEVNPVAASATFAAQISSKGKITGTGTITSGYGNETTNTAAVKGQLTKGKLSLQLSQGRQHLTFAGSGGSTGYVGTLTVTLPPGKSTIKNFAFPALPLTNSSSGVLASFAGKVSQLTSQGGFPSGAPGATVMVGSDLNGNGTIESSEQFSAQTDADGNYNLSCLVSNGGRAVIQFVLSGYAKQLKVVEPVQGGSTVQNNVTLRQLVDMTISGTTAATSDGKLEIKNLPSNIATIQGRAYNPVTEADQFPGEFADDQKNLLVSSAFASIEAKDGSGKEVHQLSKASTVRILIPKDTWNTLRDLNSGNGQIDVPLYYFDEATGQWKRSNSDGWLEDSAGTKVPETQLASLKDGSYSGSVFAVGPVTHFSYWNCDWPIDTHTCIHATVTDTNGAPVVGASVSVKGVSYNGITSPKITGPDGSFCAEIMRSEQANEDLNGNGVTGETQTVGITVFTGTNYYNFGPFNTPQAQATCAQGNCVDLGPLALSDANKLSVSLCAVTGTVVYNGTNNPPIPVAGAFVYGFDENIDSTLWYQYLTNGSSFYATADTNGSFSLTVPMLTGMTLWSSSYGTAPNATNSFIEAYGSITLPGCPSQPVTIPVDWWRWFGITGTGVTQGFLYQYQSMLECWLLSGTTYYWGQVPNGVSPQVPAQPGQTLTLDLYRTSPTYSKVGTITFTANSTSGGTWSTTGVSLSGDWGN